MAELDIAGHYSSIYTASNVFLSSLGPAFTGTPEGHIATDIAGAASVAGVLLLRQTIPDLSKYEPGTLILSETHEAQAQLYGFMQVAGRSVGVDLRKRRIREIPAAYQPLMETVEMARRLEPRLCEACTEQGLEREYWPHVAALAAMKLVGAGESMGMLDAGIGEYLALYYVAAGSKTVPYPLPA